MGFTPRMSHAAPPSVAGMKSILGLAACLALCFGAAAFGAQFMPGEWYAGLKKPAWNPPNWVFGPVWTALYTMMAVGVWLVWRRGGFAANALPLSLFLAQLVCNSLWSWMFFGRKNPGLAFADIALLWLAIAATLASFWPLQRTAAWLLVPYLVWVTFAAALNFSLWRLNH